MSHCDRWHHGGGVRQKGCIIWLRQEARDKRGVNLAFSLQPFPDNYRAPQNCINSYLRQRIWLLDKHWIEPISYIMTKLLIHEPLSDTLKPVLSQKWTLKRFMKSGWVISEISCVVHECCHRKYQMTHSDSLFCIPWPNSWTTYGRVDFDSNTSGLKSDAAQATVHSSQLSWNSYKDNPLSYANKEPIYLWNYIFYACYLLCV